MGSLCTGNFLKPQGTLIRAISGEHEMEGISVGLDELVDRNLLVSCD